jgi:outer membrane biosynthesis protein TonB
MNVFPTRPLTRATAAALGLVLAGSALLASCGSEAAVKPAEPQPEVTRPTVPVVTPAPTTTPVTEPPTTAPVTEPTTTTPATTAPKTTTTPKVTTPKTTTPAVKTLSASEISAVWSALTTAVRDAYATGDLRIINDAFASLEKKYAAANLQMGFGGSWYSIEANGGLRECRVEEERYSEETGTFIKSLVPGC